MLRCVYEREMCQCRKHTGLTTWIATSCSEHEHHNHNGFEPVCCLTHATTSRGNTFTYWTPGAVRINEPLSAAQLGKTHNHTVTAYIKEMTPATKGIVVAVGGMTGGYALYVKDDRAGFTYNFLGTNTTTITTTSDALPSRGAVELRLDVVLIPSNASLTGVRTHYCSPLLHDAHNTKK